MKKLEVGDYVKNLTEKQFDEIIKLQPLEFGQYQYAKGQTDTLCLYEWSSLGLSLEFPFTTIDSSSLLLTELTYRQFLSRAKNTFK